MKFLLKRCFLRYSPNHLKIIVTSFLDLDHDRNGVVSVANDLNRLLEQDGRRVEVVTPPTGDTSAVGRGLACLRRIIRRTHRATGAPALYLAELRLTGWDLARRIAQHATQADAVIAHDLLSARAALQARLDRCPVLLYCHFWAEPWQEFLDEGVLTEESASFRSLKAMMLEVLRDRRVVLAPVSERNAGLLRRIVPEREMEQIMTVWPGVAAPSLNDTAPAAGNAPPVIINVGKLEKRKNQRILPPVAAELVRMGHPCRFVLAGVEDPDEKTYLLKLARELGVHELFTLTGRRSRREVFSAMAQADLYLHTSLSESFGMTLVEAMAVGTPVMALEYDAVREILPETPEGVIPAAASPAEIAARLAETLGNRGRLQTMTARQHAVYRERFSPDVFLSRVLAIIGKAREVTA